MAQATRRGAETLGTARQAALAREARRGEVRRRGGKLHRAASSSARRATPSSPQVLSVISLPDRGTVVRDAVAKVWENFLSTVEEPSDLAQGAEAGRPVEAALEGLSDEEVWAEIQRRKAGGAAPMQKIKEVELETLLSVKEKLGEDVPRGRRLPGRAASS